MILLPAGPEDSSLNFPSSLFNCLPTSLPSKQDLGTVWPHPARVGERSQTGWHACRRQVASPGVVPFFFKGRGSEAGPRWERVFLGQQGWCSPFSCHPRESLSPEPGLTFCSGRLASSCCLLRCYCCHRSRREQWRAEQGRLLWRWTRGLAWAVGPMDKEAGSRHFPANPGAHALEKHFHKNAPPKSIFI